MSGIEAYNNNHASQGLEYPVDAMGGSFFNFDYRKYDLKEMLDSNKDSLKLEAMKTVIKMIAKGKDASHLFPSVVKNVVSKNIEIKKLVYVYLVRYAEEQQDLALLSISTFQRALKEPNQLIRASALRVLSNVRVSIIVPIVILAIRDAASDLSPYVRKTAAHAIPKLYYLDKKQKPELVIIIQKLLADRTVLVIGSAVMAFIEVCPERVDLIQQVFRQLCVSLADVDEWGQVIIINILTKYAQTQFLDPNLDEVENDGSSERESSIILDADHQLLLRCTRPLFQSCNSAVVMSVVQLYYYCAPKKETVALTRALVRFLHSHVEVQSVVLMTIASISYENKRMFEPYLKSFFVRPLDSMRVKLLKLDILTNTVMECNISVILRELQTYISSNDKKFVTATIQAIGRCAFAVSGVTDTCLNGLITLLSSRNEALVSESIIVIKTLLQTQRADFKVIVTHMAHLLDSIMTAKARAAILWLLGEHSQELPIAANVLRKFAKSFSEEHDSVKLQVLNLAVKLHIRSSSEIELLCQYLFNLAQYDQNYDIRDRARLLNQFILNKPGNIISQASKIILVRKPAPILKSDINVAATEGLQLGTLSHYINTRAIRYEPLPAFPRVPPPKEMCKVESDFQKDKIFNNIGNEQETLCEELLSTDSSSDSSLESSSCNTYDSDMSSNSNIRTEDD